MSPTFTVWEDTVLVEVERSAGEFLIGTLTSFVSPVNPVLFASL